MRKITDIYKEYKIMPALQEHQFRVASVAYMICDSLDFEINKKEILTTCLLHDMGNIIKFRLGEFPEFLEPEGILYWQSAQNEYFAKYGMDEHKASEEIAKELGATDRIVDLIASISFSKAIHLANEQDFAKKIVEYCDDRVTPFGVVGIEDRFNDLRTRYAHKHQGERKEKFEEINRVIREVEKQIFTQCKIRPEDITDESIKPYLEKLKDFAI